MNLYDIMLHLGYRTVTNVTDFVQCDIDQAESMRCKKCGGDCFYDGYTLYDINVSYRAFAVCNKCGSYREL